MSASFLERLASRLLPWWRHNWWLLTTARNFWTIWVLKGHGPTRKPTLIKLRYFNHPLVVRCRTSDTWAVWDLLYKGEYSPLKPLQRRVVVDCGANVGMFFVSLLRESPEGLERYIGIEPDVESFKLLERQVALCGAINKVTLHNVAIYDKDTLVQFDDSSDRDWEHRVSPSGRKQIRASSLPSLLDSAGVQECDLLKVDIEGSEKELFGSIGDWKHRVKAIVCELHKELSYDWFAGLMSAAGFTPFPAGQLFRVQPGAIRRM
jgi:FkbM family methyltransferase